MFTGDVPASRYCEQSENNCNLDNYTANATATQTVICRDTKPLNDPTDFIITEDPCADVMNMAIAMAQHIIKLRRQSLLEEFEKLYRAKCMLTNGIEEFTVKYTPKEYHYTLYYYDMAGNLVKTVPPKGVKPDFSPFYTDQVKADRENGVFNPRPHQLITQYRYNSLGQVVAQNSPDANTSHFWYDKLGRLVVSQNAQQAIPPSGGGGAKYSYTLYDDLGRITEVGQKPQTMAMTQTISQDKHPTVPLKDWILTQGGTREQITFTVYDLPYLFDPPNPPGLHPLLTQQNLRNRVSYTGTINLATDPQPQQYTATFFTYDIHGNVDTVVQDYHGVPAMATETEGNLFKMIAYDYDLISGKVNMVSYQPPRYNSETEEWETPGDGFYHKYKYDAENRLTEVETSRDKIVWERDAAYNYYKHGPLARTEYGQLRMQGIDYAYTLQGWLKGVNSTAISASGIVCPEGTVLGTVLNVTDRAQYSQPPVYTASQEINFEPGFESVSNDEFETLIDPNGTVCTPGQGNNIPYTQGDMGRDGDPTDLINDKVARDAFGFALNYYNNDYKAIAPGVQTFANGMHNLPQLDNDGMITGAELFNGNIASMLVNIPKLGIPGNGNSGTNPILYGYRYDQLNRIVGMNAYKNDPANSQPNTFSPVVMADYKERISYDPNGSIQTLQRNGYNRVIDNATWHYYSSTHRLEHINDPAGRFSWDAGVQNINNYIYNAIGQMTGDEERGLANIGWTVYGKVKNQTVSGTNIFYSYDAANNRITKKVADTIEVYVRDARGNVLSIYKKKGSDALKQAEINLYGSSRLGNVKEQTVAPQTIMLLGGFGEAKISTFTRVEKFFEMSDHRGNALATLSDKKIQVSTNNTTVDHYEPDVFTAQDYSSFGALLENRQYGTTPRYTYNGKQLDKETGWQEYGMREYMGGEVPVFVSVDPLTKKFPFYSPYHYAGNSPVKNVDLDGAEPAGNSGDWDVLQIGKVYAAEHKLNDGTTVLARAEQQLVKDKIGFKGWITHMTWTDTYQGLSAKANYYSWFNEDPNLGAHPKSEKRWEGFETEIMTRQRHIQENARSLAIGVFSVGAIGAAIPAAIPTLSVLGTQRSLSIGVDYLSQVGGNYLSGRRGIDALTNINLSSLLVSAANPTSSWKGLFANNLSSNALSYSVTEGYNGLGAGKSLETVLFQSTLSTFAGKATSGLDIGINKFNIRLNHVNRLQGDGSPLSTSLQSLIRNYQLRAAAIGTTTGVPSEGLNNSMENP